MLNILAVFYYFFSGLNGSRWFLISILTPFFAVILLCIILNFTAQGRFIKSAVCAKRFVRQNGLITAQNKDIFYEKCIKHLPSLFIVDYKSFINGKKSVIETDIKTLFRGIKQLMTAIYDGLWIIFLSIALVGLLIEGVSGSLILFCALSPMPIIIFNRIVYIGIICFYDYRARASYLKILSLINNEWSGRRFLEDSAQLEV